MAEDSDKKAGGGEAAQVDVVPAGDAATVGFAPSAAEAPSAREGRKIWHAVPIPGRFTDDERAEVGVRGLKGSLTVIKRAAIDEDLVTIVGSMLPAVPKDADAEKRLVSVPGGLLSGADGDAAGDEQPAGANGAEDAVFALRNKYKFTRTVGYLPTDQAGCYVRVVRRNLLLALIPIFVAAAIAAALILLQNGGIPGLDMDPNQTDPWDAQQATQQSKDTITVDGVSAIKVDSTHTSWPLKNPDVRECQEFCVTAFKFCRTSRILLLCRGRA